MTANVGLTDEQLVTVETIFARYNITRAVVFGSRAKGNYKPYSDVDIAIWGALDRLDTERIKQDFEEENLVLDFDLLHYEQINNTSLKMHIDRVGVVIYKCALTK